MNWVLKLDRMREGKTGQLHRGLRCLLGAVLCAILLAGCAKSTAERIAEQLELGNRYLLETDYEGAVVAFQKVIELDPKNIDGYFGMGQAREGQAEALLADSRDQGMEYYRLAAEAYEQVLILSPQDSRPGERLIVIYKELGDVEKYLEALNRLGTDGEVRDQEEIRGYADFIEQLTESCEGEDFEGIFQLMQEEVFQELQTFVQETGDPIVFARNGYGAGLYPVSTEDYGDCMVYYGEFTGETRQGSGLWLGYHDGNNYYAKGEWAEDMPNGAFEVREWNSDLNERVVYRVLTGGAESGLWNGPVEWSFIDNDGTRSFPVSFDNGMWVVLRYDDDGEAIVSELPEGEQESSTMTAHTPDKLEGIEGFLQ